MNNPSCASLPSHILKLFSSPSFCPSKILQLPTTSLHSPSARYHKYTYSVSKRASVFKSHRILKYPIKKNIKIFQRAITQKIILLQRKSLALWRSSSSDTCLSSQGLPSREVKLFFILYIITSEVTNKYSECSTQIPNYITIIIESIVLFLSMNK